MPSLPLNTLTDVWHNTVGKYPGREALVCAGRRHSFRELDRDIARLAGRLQDLGVAPGDRVAVAMPNCLEFYLAYWATLRAGAILAPVNTRLGEREMRYVFDNVAARVIFVHREVMGECAPALPDGPHRIGVEVADTEPFDEALAAGREPDPVAVSTEDVAFIAHTSGTTGVPKGAIMRHADLLFNIKNTVIPFSWRHEDRNLLLVPLFHATGLYSVVPSSAYLGATVVVAPRPDPREVVDLIETPYTERELMLIKVRAVGKEREEMKRMADIFRGRIIDVTDRTYTIELTGDGVKLDAFIDALDRASILETVRTGASGIARGERVLKV